MILAWLWVLVSLVGVLASLLVYIESRSFLEALRSTNPELIGAYSREALRDRLILVAQIANLIVGASSLYGASLTDGQKLLHLLLQSVAVVGLFAVPILLTTISLTNWFLRRRRGNEEA